MERIGDEGAGRAERARSSRVRGGAVGGPVVAREEVAEGAEAAYYQGGANLDHGPEGEPDGVGEFLAQA